MVIVVFYSTVNISKCLVMGLIVASDNKHLKGQISFTTDY